MTIVIIVVFAALFAVLFLQRIARGHEARLAGLEDLQGRTEPVDLDAFRNLIDPQETEFLRRRLPPQTFRQLHRERTLAAADYVRCIAKNAAVLLQLGQVTRDNADPEIARTAQEMIRLALSVRMSAMSALVALHVQSVWPGAPFSSDEVFERYRRLTESAVLFTRLQRPAFSGRVAAML